MKVFERALLLLAGLLATACSDAPTKPPAVASVTIAVPNSTPLAGTSQTISASPKAADGTSLTGRATSWNSSNPQVATISAGGVLAAVAVGSAVITATIEGKSATATVSVQQQPVATITVTAPTTPLVAGETRQLVATARDVNGTILTGRTILWSSSATATATVSADGLVSTLWAGTAVITVVSEGKSATTTLTILPQTNPPDITSVSQTSLVPGTSVVITGARFAANTLSNRVTIRGVAAPVTSASATQLTVTVPCVNSGVATLSVGSLGADAPPVTLPVVVATRTLAVGQALIISSSAASACNELTAATGNARYLIAVFNASTSPNTLINFEIAGNPTPLGSTVADAPAAINATRVASGSWFAAPFGTAFTSASGNLAEDAREAARDDAHWRHLERERVEYERQMRMKKSRPAAVRIIRDVALPAVGDPREFYLIFGGTNGCADTSRPMQTKAVYVGTRAIIWEDAANALQSNENTDLAGYYRRLGQIFDQDQYDALKNTFGDPLLRDSLTDGDQRIHMVFTQKLNGTGAAAYVTGCDQFPRSQNAGSNFGEVFYGTVPVTAGSNMNSTNFPDGWFYFMGRTVVHEVKHIVSVAARVNNNSPVSEASWLEEGTARHAEEIWVRESLHHVPWKGNTGFGTAATNGIYCDFHPLDATCNAADVLRRPSYGMRRQFNEIREKLLAPWDWSPYGDATGQSGSVFYQTAWSLVRYTIDRYATSDAAFFKTLINSSTNSTTNLAATAGVSIDQLIGGWGLALFADDYPGIASPNADLQFQTWNLRSIYSGLNASPNWTARFNTAFPIQPTQLSFGSFLLSQGGVRGGAHAYYELFGTNPAAQLIQLRGAGGGALSGNARIAIARLQ